MWCLRLIILTKSDQTRGKGPIPTTKLNAMTISNSRLEHFYLHSEFLPYLLKVMRSETRGMPGYDVM